MHELKNCYMYVTSFERAPQVKSTCAILGKSHHGIMHESHLKVIRGRTISVEARSPWVGAVARGSTDSVAATRARWHMKAEKQ